MEDQTYDEARRARREATALAVIHEAAHREPMEGCPACVEDEDYLASLSLPRIMELLDASIVEANR